ncbi:HD domain-containing phosphohydrolase [candidate division KSB1 bacterium]
MIPLHTKNINKNVIYSDDRIFEELSGFLERNDIRQIKTQDASKEIFDDSLSIFLVSNDFLKNNLEKFKSLKKSPDDIFISIVFISKNEMELISDIDIIDDIIQLPVNKVIFQKKINKYFSDLYLKYESVILKKELGQRTKEIGELSQIGSMLMMEKDLDKLLNEILLRSREITSADAGSLYMIEENEEKKKHLRFKLSHNDSLDISYEEFTMPISKKSIAGYVAVTGETLNIEDVYKLPPEKELKFNKSLDQKFGYRTKSILTIPLKNHVDEIIGVIQLINKKKNLKKLLKTPEDFANEVIVFNKRDEDLLYALGGQAAVSIENNLLYRSIENLFEGFVKASVTAIESRDPSTHGHSQRVAILTVGIAEIIHKINTGKYANQNFSSEQIKEIRYASLLHDFGKVGVKENVLLKEKKLYLHKIKEIQNRFFIIKQNLEIKKLRKKLDYLLKFNNENLNDFLNKIEKEYNTKIQELDKYLNTIIQSNEPTILAEDNLNTLKKITEIKLMFPEFGEINLLTTEEFNDLSIKKGSLNEQERLEIESHVTHTFKFLSLVPWTKELKNIPDIAHTHHEKLDGVGYPRKLHSDEIPIQAKMMIISDIFDALTASDRPYKKAVPYQKALNILKMDVKSNHIDKDLVNLFINTKIYEKVITL